MSKRYYQLTEIIISDEIPPPGFIRLSTAAVLSCSLCGFYIDGSGGPSDGAICHKCGDAMRHGDFVGFIQWVEKND